MKVFKKIILFTFLFVFLLPAVSISNKSDLPRKIIQTASAQTCGDGIISGDEECDTNGAAADIGCADPDKPYCNVRCTSCVCSQSKFVFLDKPVVCSIQDLILFLLSIIGSIALLMIILGSVLYVFAGANPEAQTKAKKTVTWAIIGLILVLISYAIMKAISDIGT